MFIKRSQQLDTQQALVVVTGPGGGIYVVWWFLVIVSIVLQVRKNATLEYSGMLKDHSLISNKL